MVKFFYRPPIPVALKDVFDKSLWIKIKALNNYIKEHNPTLAYFAVPTYPVLMIGGIVLGYFKYKSDRRPKYYEYYMIMRPDDPRVKNIRYDDSLRIADPCFHGQLSTAR